MKKPIIRISSVAVALGVSAFSVSCQEKSEQVKKVEEATEKAVASGEMTKEQAKDVNKAAEKADDIKDEAQKIVNKQLEDLEKADTPDKMKAVIKEATKSNVELAVKAGGMTKDQADLTLSQLDSIDQLPEPALKQMVEQLKAALKQAQTQAK